MVSATHVASYLYAKQPDMGKMKLHKLLYYSQGWSLAWAGVPLFEDALEAWTMGPVVPAVQHMDASAPYVVGSITDEHTAMIDAVYAHYGQMSGKALGDQTHQETPWLEARGDLPVDAPSRNIISHATMKKFFTRVAIDSDDIPTRKLIHRVVSNETFLASVAIERERWRGALDALALR